MKNKTLTAALRKAGHEVVRRADRKAEVYRAVKGDLVVEWHVQGESAVIVHLTRLSTPDDMMTDRGPGTYARRIKDAVAHLARPS